MLSMPLGKLKALHEHCRTRKSQTAEPGVLSYRVGCVDSGIAALHRGVGVAYRQGKPAKVASLSDTLVIKSLDGLAQ